MKNSFKIILLACLSILTACNQVTVIRQSSVRQELHSGWEFKSTDDNLWWEASVPGCVHTDLMQHGLIPDPYFRANEDDVQWVTQKIWEYRTYFAGNNVVSDFCAKELVFEGIDTHAEIFLNGEKLSAETASGCTDNMFRTWRFDVSEKLNETRNELLIRFYPADNYNEKATAKLPYKLPEERAFSRKAPYQFGWDWGPKLPTCGLWKPVKLLAWNDFKIENIQITQQSLADEAAQLEMILEITADKATKAALSIFVDEQEVISSKKIRLKKGLNIVRKLFEIKQPERWNPNGLGVQRLYHISASVMNKKHIDQEATNIGLRTIELKREKDSIGTSFTFYVNGNQVFMKGANYIPQDNFPHRVTAEQYEKLLSSAKSANMNMLRVWGGGIYESDYFYHLCDSLGILIWQDFMFACALYPSDSAFLSTVQHEAEDQVKRLRNHACIALWCGNNEVKNGWDDWGWQRQYTDTQREEIWVGNQKIFEQMLPSIIEKCDAGRPYHASSPEWGWGHPESLTDGDSHYWGVWWGEQPFEVWETKTGRFMSEYGFQAMPNYSTIESFTLPADRYLQSAVMKAHQKHSRGYELINTYMQRDYKVPRNFFHYTYVSQLLQAHGVGQALEIHRRRQPHCMGTLYWQLNDCWPVTSWSSIDSRYQWKALHYKARECFKQVILTSVIEGDELVFYAVSDLPYDISGTVSVCWQSFQGQALDTFPSLKNMTIAKNSSQAFLRMPYSRFTGYLQNSMIVAHFDDGKGTWATKIHYFAPPKMLSLPYYKLNTTVENIGNSYRISLSGNALVKNLYLYTNPTIDGFFSDNFFDLLPNETKVVTFTPADGADSTNFEKQLKTLSLKDAW